MNKLPLPETERARLTEELIRHKGTDTHRWSEKQNLATQWDARAARAAGYIPEGMHVLDIGCGAMALKAYLKPGSRYTPADVVKRSADCLVIDMNAGQFPPGAYDWVTFLGVLEYIHDVPWALLHARKAAPHLLLTYCADSTGGAAQLQRRGMGWVNDYTLEQMRVLISAAGWTLEKEMLDKQGQHNQQWMFVCRRKEE